MNDIERAENRRRSFDRDGETEDSKVGFFDAPSGFPDYWELADITGELEFMVSSLLECNDLHNRELVKKELEALKGRWEAFPW